jgi:glycine/D-amino acid oxidase-like deaminating enzyme
MIDDLLPVALDTYRELEYELGLSLINQCDILDFHVTADMKDVFEKRALEEKEYLHTSIVEDGWKQYFTFHYSIGQIAPCLLINLSSLLQGWRNKLRQENALVEEQFEWRHCILSDENVIYKDIIADKIICCEGAGGFDNPYFSLLPYSRNKGEVIIASIPDLPRTHIYKSGLKILPWQDDLFWIGASFEWKYGNLNPTPAYRKQVEMVLSHWLKLPYTIVDHWAAERPATVEYKPFVGLHPLFPLVGIFNGMGTKGCSLAPYFARQFSHYLSYGVPILPDVDVSRFTRILSRK